MILNELFSRYILGLIRNEEIPTVAANALAQGHDSPALRVLAGLGSDNSELICKLLYKSMEELNVPLYSKEQAGKILTRAIARDVIDGRIEPYDGAKRIWNEVYVVVPSLKEIHSIVGMASEYEDDEVHREAYSNMIRTECRNLLFILIDS